jgi:hypothetical protein
VRPRDTPKQRLRLGTSRYCGGGWNAATNPGSDSYTTNNSYSLRSDNANSDAKRASAGHANTYSDSTGITHTDADANTHGYGNTDAANYSDANTYGEFTAPVAHATTEGNTKASAHAASSAITLSLRIGETATLRAASWSVRPPRHRF